MQGWSIYSNLESTRIFTTQIQPVLPARGKSRFTKFTSYFFLRDLSVKDSHMIKEMTKCDKVVNTNSAEVFYGPPMISHVIPKVFKSRFTKRT